MITRESSLDDCDLPIQLIHRMTEHGKPTVGDVMGMPDNEFLRVPGVGRKYLGYWKEFIKEHVISPQSNDDETELDMCRTCKFWDYQRQDADEYAECHHRPPRIGKGSIGVWPMVAPENWCGKWSRRK